MRKIRWEQDRNEKKMNSKGTMECRMNVPKCVWMLSSAQPFTTRSLLTTSFVVSFLIETCIFFGFCFYRSGMGSGSETLFLSTYFCSWLCTEMTQCLLFCFVFYVRKDMCARGQACTVSSSHHLCGEFLGVFIQFLLKIMSQMCRKRIFSPSWAHVEGILFSNPVGVHGWETPQLMQSCFIETSFFEWDFKAV